MLVMPSIKTPSGGHARAKSGGGGARGSASGNGAAALDKRLLVLRLLACAVVLYGELFMFTREIGSCSWPDEFGFDVRRKKLLYRWYLLIDTLSFSFYGPAASRSSSFSLPIL